MAAQRPSEFDPAIHRGRLDRLCIFEISEAELETLERGTTGSIYLNLAVAVLSVAISLSASLATATFPSDRAFYVFVIITVISYLAGATFGLLWFNSRRSMRNVATEIRSRIPPPGGTGRAADRLPVRPPASLRFASAHPLRFLG